MCACVFGVFWVCVWVCGRDLWGFMRNKRETNTTPLDDSQKTNDNNKQKKNKEQIKEQRQHKMPKLLQRAHENLTHLHQQNPQVCGFLAVFFKISLAAAVLTVFAINFSTALDDNRKLEELQEESLFSSASSLVLEDTAVERGMSLVYMASARGNEEFYGRLHEQRQKLDNSIQAGLKEMKETVKYSSEKDVLQLFEDWVDELPAFRDRVDDREDLNMTITDIMEYYTQINALLIYAVAEFTTNTDGDVTKRALAWKHLLFEFDNLEKQRSLGTSALVCPEGAWPIDAYVMFVQASGRVIQAQASFYFTTTKATWERYLKMLESDQHKVYLEMRTLVEEEGGREEDGAAKALTRRGWGDPVLFWDGFGDYLEVVGEFRETSLRDLKEYSDQALDETKDRLVTNGIGLGIGIVACVYILVEAGWSSFENCERKKKVKELDSKFAAEAKDVDEWSPT